MAPSFCKYCIKNALDNITDNILGIRSDYGYLDLSPDTLVIFQPRKNAP